MLRRALLVLTVVVAAPVAAKSQHEKMLESGQIYRDAELTEYVSAVGERMARAAGLEPGEVEFYVQDSTAVNAMATHEQRVYVSRGLLAYLDTEAQVAAVLGHEIGHLTARHHRKRTSAAVTSQVLSTAAGILTGSRELMAAGQEYSSVLISGYGREMELEADRLGAEYLAKAGYNPNAMIDVIRILKDQDDFAGEVEGNANSYHGLFASHPRNDRRLHEAVREGAAGVDQTQYVEPVGDYLARLDGLAWGQAAAAGLVKDGRYYHRRLGLVVDFPEGWSVRDSPSSVTANPIHGTATMITLEAVQPEHGSPKAVIERQLGHEIGDGREIEVGEALPGYLATVRAKGEGEAGSRKLVAAILKDEFAYVFTGENEREDYQRQFVQAFSRTVASFREMTEADAEAARTQRLEIIEAKPEDTYEALARRSALGRNAADRLRLINGDFPRGQPRAGDRIKIVR